MCSFVFTHDLQWAALCPGGLFRYGFASSSAATGPMHTIFIETLYLDGYHPKQ